MSIIQALRDTNIEPRSLGMLFDVDGCLVNPNNHTLNERQTQTLKDLFNLTGGSVALFTDNDMRLVYPMVPFMPIVSEGGAVRLIDDSRDIRDADIISAKANISAMVDFALAEIKSKNIQTFTEHTAQTNADKNRIIGEVKQTRMGLNWGGESQHLKAVAMNVGRETLLSRNRTNFFDVVGESYDCVEITPKGFIKPQQVASIAHHTRFRGLKTIMFGDSPIDSMAGKEIDGCVAIGNRMAHADHIMLRLQTPAALWDSLEQLRDYYKVNQHNNYNRASVTQQTIPAQRARFAPAVQ